MLICFNTNTANSAVLYQIDAAIQWEKKGESCE